MHALSGSLLPAAMSRNHKCYYPNVISTPWYISNSQICKDFDVPFFAAKKKNLIAVTNSFASPGSPQQEAQVNTAITALTLYSYYD
jgi:hypothetical protein